MNTHNDDRPTVAHDDSRCAGETAGRPCETAGPYDDHTTAPMPVDNPHLTPRMTVGYITHVPAKGDAIDDALLTRIGQALMPAFLTQVRDDVVTAYHHLESVAGISEDELASKIVGELHVMATEEDVVQPTVGTVSGRSPLTFDERNEGARYALATLLWVLSDLHTTYHWAYEIEYSLWSGVLNGPPIDGYPAVQDTEMAALRLLAYEAGGWFWSPSGGADANDVQFIEMGAWTRMYDAWLGDTDDTEGDAG